MENEQESQKEAQKNNELPENTQPEMTPIEEYQKENEQAKDKLAEFGETDIEQFVTKVSSNSIYARQVVRKFLGLDGDQPFVNMEHKTSPQEGGTITGKLVHTQYPPLVVGGPSGTSDESVK